jgi:hypothetical protein
LGQLRQWRGHDERERNRVSAEPLQPGFDPIDYATRGIAFERPQDLEAMLAGIRAFQQATS